MKTGMVVGGITLLLAGGLFGVVGLTTTCSDNPLAQALFRLPSCSSMLALAFVGVAFSILGVVLIVLGAAPHEIPRPQWYPPQPPEPPAR